MKIRGQCHCGNLSYELDTQIAESDIKARACDCGFCRIHAAKNWSDPNGRGTVEVKNPQQLQRYLFALATAEFFICRVCGAYLAAVLSATEGTWSTVNLRLSNLSDVPEESASYGSEGEGERISRRKRVWTPTLLVGLPE
jgi:hypothetical protein